MTNEYVMERWGSKVFFILFIYILIAFAWGDYKGGAWTWKDWEVSGIGVYHVNFPKN